MAAGAQPWGAHLLVRGGYAPLFPSLIRCALTDCGTRLAHQRHLCGVFSCCRTLNAFGLGSQVIEAPDLNCAKLATPPESSESATTAGTRPA